MASSSTLPAEAVMPRTKWQPAEKLALALVLLPLLVSAVVLVVRVGTDYHPVSDWALTEMRTRDVGRYQVLVGLYSRFGWSHPGPMSFYLYALPYRLTGSNSIGLYLGGLLINGAAITGMATIARRRGGTPLILCTLLAVGLLVRTLGADYVRNPWNCAVTVLPYGLLLFLTWAMLCGRVWALPVAAAVTTFLAQTHVQYVALAVPLLGLGALSLAVGTIRQRHASRAGAVADTPTTRDAVYAGGISFAILVWLWSLPVAQQLRDNPGNMTAIIDWFRDTKERGYTLADGYHVVTAQFGIRPEWLTTLRGGVAPNGETAFLGDAPRPWLLLVAVAATYVCWRRRDRDALRFAFVIGFALVIGIVAVARTAGVMYAYRMQWTWLIAMAAMVLVAWTTWKVLDQRYPAGSARMLVPLALVAIAAVSAANTVSPIRSGDPQGYPPAILGRLVRNVKDRLPTGDGDVIVDRAFSYYGPGLLLALERQGLRARVDADPDRFFGDGRRRVHTAGPVRARLFVAVDGEFDAAFTTHDGELIAYWGSVPADERERVLAEMQLRRDSLGDALKAGRLTQAEYVSQLQGVNALMPTVPGVTITAAGIFMKRP